MKKLLSKILTDNQRSFMIRKNIKVGNFYRFPAFGFYVYPTPSYEHGEKMETNPFTKSLSAQFFNVKELTDNGFAKGNFEDRPKGPDFYLEVTELQTRGIWEMLILFLILVIPFCLYNLFIKGINKFSNSKTNV